MVFHVYILQSETTGRYYVGQTQDLTARIAYHNANYSRALKNREIKRQKDRRYIGRLVGASR